MALSALSGCKKRLNSNTPSSFRQSTMPGQYPHIIDESGDQLLILAKLTIHKE